jgi:hypothetical protein
MGLLGVLFFLGAYGGSSIAADDNMEPIGSAAEPANLENRSFAFADGAVFHSGLAGEATTLLFGAFPGDS